MDFRARFAPSPTGQVHIGNIRTAIFNWLATRHNKGTFLLRIEDTDLERSTQDAIDKLLECTENRLFFVYPSLFFCTFAGNFDIANSRFNPEP